MEMLQPNANTSNIRNFGSKSDGWLLIQVPLRMFSIEQMDSMSHGSIDNGKGHHDQNVLAGTTDDMIPIAWVLTVPSPPQFVVGHILHAKLDHGG